jgi:tetratricopeptide (TPR) repeat protein
MALDSSTARGPVGDELRVVTALGRMLSTMVATQVPGARVEQSDIQPKSFQAWRLTAHAEALARELSKGPGDAEWERAIARADSILLEAQRLDPNWIVPTLRRSAISRWRGTSATGRLDQLRWLNASLAQADWVLRTGATGAYASDAYQLRGAARFFIARGDLVSGRAEKNAMLAGAEADLKESTRIAPNNAAAWRGLSTLYAAKPDLPASMRAAAMAYRANPFTLGAQVLDRMYRTAYISEEFDHARDYCDEGRLRFPQDVRFAECRLWLFTVGKKPELGEVWGAVDDLLRLAGKFRREWYRREGHVVAAIALGRHGLADSARGVLRALPDTSAIVDPDHELLYFKAYAYLTLRDRTAALRRLQMILDLHPELREAWASNSPWWWRDISGDEVFRTLLRR